jgi:NADH:ubiquinone oxidoreductase subunit K
MNLSLILFLIGIFGFVLNRKNIILMLISIEIMLLAITFLILVSSLSFEDILGQTYAIYVIAIAGAESAIGLGILVAFYRLYSSLNTACLSLSLKTYLKNKINSYTHYPSSLYFSNISFITKSNKGINKIRSYSTNAFNEKVNTSVLGIKGSTLVPWFITGLFDAESSFVVTILKNSKYKTGWNVQARVQIKMHEKDRPLILAIQNYFGGIGYVSKPNKASTVEFRVSTLKDLVNIILPHFDKYPLISKKGIDYLLFKQIVLLMLNEGHHTLEGIKKIVNIRASLNTGLSDALKEAFPNWKAVSIKDLESSIKNNISYVNIHPDWLAGFATGESNFFIAVQKAKTNSGISTSLRFSIAQHSRDLLLLQSFINFFGGGFVVNSTKRPICEFVVAKFDIILNYIIPFFDKHPILGSKHLIYLDFKSAAYIIKNKEHLNKDGVGLNQILQLKKRITSLYSNKAINNHSVEEGTEMFDQKR